MVATHPAPLTRGRPARISIPALLLLVWALALPAAAAADAPTLAVTDFANRSGDPKWAPLGAGLADMLITDLTQLSGVQVVERAQLGAILAELERQQTAAFDPDSAVELGRLLGAQWVLTGSIAAVDPEMRVDARVVEVATGKVAEAATVTGPSAEFFLLEKELAQLIVKRLDLAVSARESARMGRVATESFEAFVQYSRGLEALDHGEVDEARRAMAAALEADDRFALATRSLKELQRQQDELAAKRRSGQGALTQELLAALDAADGGSVPEALPGLLSQALTELQPQLRPAETAQVARRLLDRGLPESLTMGPYVPISANEWALFAATLAAQRRRLRADVVAYGQLFVQRYPESSYFSSVAQALEAALESVEAEGATQDRVPWARVQARYEGLSLACGRGGRLLTRLPTCRQLASLVHAPELDERQRKDARARWIDAAVDAGLSDELQPLLAAAQADDPYSEETSKLDRAVQAADRTQDALQRRREQLEAGAAEGSLRWWDYRDALRTFVRAGREDEARALIAPALAAFPEETGLYSAVASAYLDMHDGAAVLELLPAWEAVAAAKEQSVPGATVRAARKLVEEGPADPDPRGRELHSLGVELRGLGQHRLAAQAFEQLAEERPHAELCPLDCALHAAGMERWQAWEPDAARALWTRVLQEHPLGEWADDAARNLELLLP